MSRNDARTATVADNHPLTPAGNPLAVDACASASDPSEPDWLTLSDDVSASLDEVTVLSAQARTARTAADAEQQGQRVEAVILTIIFAVAAGEVIAIGVLLW